MKIVKKTAAADKVLSVLLAMFKTQKPFGSATEVVVRSYVNGRENGWTIEVYDGTLTIPAVTFSESRNSDDIVVYGDNGRHFGVETRGDDPRSREAHGISEKAYDGKRYFRPGETIKAAQFAFTALTNQPVAAEREETKGKSKATDNY